MRLRALSFLLVAGCGVSGTARFRTPAATAPGGAASALPAAALTTHANTCGGSSEPAPELFSATSVFNLPIGSGAQWAQNQQLESSALYINTTGSGYYEAVYVSSAGDPLVTVTNTAGAGGTPGTYQLHIPQGAQPASGNDETFAVDDTSSGIWYSFGGFQWTGSSSATASQGSAESDTDDGITVADSDWDEGVGTLRETDLQAGVINHMLRCQLPSDVLMSYSSTSTNVLCPYCWPQTAEDGFAINGNGGTPYSGTVPYGVTVGIPAGTPEPSAVAANAGAHMLWQALMFHGAMVRDSAGSGLTLILQSDQNVNPSDPLIQGMMQLGGQILQAAQILTNQGPNSINGGGNPLIPLDGSTTCSGSNTGSSTAGSVATSANGTIITPGSGTLTDSSGNTYSINASGNAMENGSPIPGGSGTSEMEYWSNAVYGQDATTGAWYIWNGSIWSSASTPGGSGGAGSGAGKSTGGASTGGSSGGATGSAPSGGASANGTVITPGAGTLTDSSGNTYSINGSGNAMENGSPIPGGSGTSEMEYWNNAVYGQDATTGAWYIWDGSIWSSALAPGGSGGAGSGTGGSTGGASTGGGSGGTTGNAPSGGASANGTVITPGSGTLTDSSGNTYSIDASGNAMENGSPIPGGSGTSEMEYWNNAVYGQDATTGAWYIWNGSIWSSASAPGGASSGGATGGGSGSGGSSNGGSGGSGSAATGSFHISNGQIIDPNGNVFVARGIDMGPQDMGSTVQNDQGQPLTALFSGINFIRMADGNRTSASAYQSFIAVTSALGIVVEIEDHPWPEVAPYTGSALQDELGWYTSLANAFMGNPYVWFGTLNEPQTSYGSAEAAISAQHAAIYQALRGTGSNTILMMDCLGGGNPGTIGGAFGMTPSVYTAMTNVVWDLHYYGWVSNYSADQATVTADLLGSVASGSGILAEQSMTSADGVVPVIIGEYGDSTDGETIDANADQVITAVDTSGYGSAAWAWYPDNEADILTDGNGNLTSYGQQIAQYIAN